MSSKLIVNTIENTTGTHTINLDSGNSSIVGDLTVGGDLTATGVTMTGDFLPSTDNTSDLGSTAKRFQNLHLSGGVNFDDNPTAVGGSVVSKTLDDYEEGTFTPTFGGASFTESGQTISSAVYVKVGELVHVRFKVDFTGTSGYFASSDSFFFTTGLPFTNNVRTSTGSIWGSSNWVGGARSTGTAMAYDTSIYCGFEYSGNLLRSSPIYVAVTYRQS